jgi:hypothetical protein
MTSRVDKVNQVVIALLGLLCLATGVLTLLMTSDVFGEHVARIPLLPNSVRGFAHRNHDWFWPAVAAGVGVAVLALLWWLFSQLSTATAGPVELEPDPAGGRTRLRPAALTSAVAGEVEAFGGVRQADAVLYGGARDRLLRLDVVLDDTADIPAVRGRIEDIAVAHARRAAGRPDLPVWLRLRPTPVTHRTVR